MRFQDRSRGRYDDGHDDDDVAMARMHEGHYDDDAGCFYDDDTMLETIVMIVMTTTIATMVFLRNSGFHRPLDAAATAAAHRRYQRYGAEGNDDSIENAKF